MAFVIVMILLTLALSAFFSGSEIAFVTANKLGVEIERDKGTRRSKIIAAFYNHPKKFLSTILVGNNIVLVLYTYYITLLIEPVIEMWVSSDSIRSLLLTIISTLFILFLGEYFPKILFRAFANRALAIISYPLYFFQWVLGIPVFVMMSLSNMLIKYIFRVPVAEAEGAFTRLDLQDYVEGSLAKDQDEMEAEMFKNALQLKNLKARECMVPRTEIVHLDIEESLDDLKKIFTETRHSRILISAGDIDNILGYIHHQSLLNAPTDLKELIIPIQHFPEVTSALDIMTIFTRQKNNIAVVVDEFGGTAGIITLEDITEEIFGEIEDEHDLVDYIEEVVNEKEYLFSGRLEIDYLNNKYPELHFPEGDFETLSGYIVMTSGEIPEMGKDFELDDYRFVIEKVTDKKIEEVRVFLINPND